MARHGGGHGRPGGRGRPGGHRRPRGRMLQPVPMFGYRGGMGFAWLLAPFMGIMFVIMLVGGIIGTLTNFSTILGVLCIVAAFALLYQARSKEKPKRKNSTYDYEDDDTFYDDEFDDGQII